MTDNLISYAAGMSYGLTSVAVGQPFDTIKTRMQARPENMSVGMLDVGMKLFQAEGITGLYRGGVPLLCGGGLMRSVQFGVYETVIRIQQDNLGPSFKIFGFLDWQIIVAGFCGGVGRGMVEGPVDYIKVRRQVAQPWRFTQMYHGNGATMIRNSFLFGSFVVYADISKQLVPGGLGPFLTGAVCANLAWLTVWPMDVVKSQVQSGNFKGQSWGRLIWNLIVSGRMFRGIMPGLARSTVANGCAMVMFKKTKSFLEGKFGEGRGSGSTF